MTAITIDQARTRLNAMLEAQVGGMLSVSINGRTVTYRSLTELDDAIIRWSRIVTNLERTAAGGSPARYSLARFGQIS